MGGNARLRHRGPQYGPPARVRLFRLLPSFLNSLEVVDCGLGIAAIELKGRHVLVNGGQAVLQSLSKVIVVKLVVSESSEWWSIDVRALACFADGVTASTQLFEQLLSVLLLAIQREAGLAPDTNHHECGADFRYDR